MFHRKRLVAGKSPETELKNLVRAEFLHSKKIYGVRRITASLHSKGNDINHKTVHRIMKKFGLRF